jgi:hypothetical protein
MAGHAACALRGQVEAAQAAITTAVVEAKGAKPSGVGIVKLLGRRSAGLFAHLHCAGSVRSCCFAFSEIFCASRGEKWHLSSYLVYHCVCTSTSLCWWPAIQLQRWRDASRRTAAAQRAALSRSV